MPNPAQVNGGQLVSLDGRTLPLREAALRAEAQGGLSRTVLRQRFVNPYAQPLSVTYRMPLPADGAVSAYSFDLDGRRVRGEVDRKAAARERFEQALVEGRTAGIVEEERSSLFTQELGNLPPHAELVAELIVDQKLAFLPEGLWEWRFPTVAAPRYLGGAVADPEKVSLEVGDRPMPVGVSLQLRIGDSPDVLVPESPSHRLHASRLGGSTEVTFAVDSSPALDRDVVVRWNARAREVRAHLEVARPHAPEHGGSEAYGLLTLTPPDALPRPLSRDLVLLIDTSGSMSGAPLDQARRVLLALLQSLSDQDRLEMVEFSNSPRRWKSAPVYATEAHRKDAARWLAGLKASGGTQMQSGVFEALRPLRPDSQRQVVLITDGLIGSEAEIVKALLESLPQGCRFHSVGVGSAVNRSLTAATARAGRGVELFVGLDEDAERIAARLIARTAAPLVTELSVEGDALLALAPQRAPDLYAQSPALLSMALRPEGGTLWIRGRRAEGSFEHRINVPACGTGTGNGALAALYAREAVEDWEMRRIGGHDPKRVDEAVERLGLTFQISTRLTSWVAISEERTVDPTRPSRHERVPQMLPYGMSAEGLGLRAVATPAAAPAGAAFAAPKQHTPLDMIRERAADVWRDQPTSHAKKGMSGALQRSSLPPASPVRGEPAGGAELKEPPAQAGDKSALSVQEEQVQTTQRRQGRARVRRGQHQKLWLELTWDEGGAWTRPTTVTLHFADGRRVEATVQPSDSTASTSLMPGDIVRLTVELKEVWETLGALLRVSAVDAHGDWEVVL